MARGIFLDPGQGTIYSARGSKMVFKALHETTAGAFSLMERDLPVSNRRPQPHMHKGPEGFYVLEGSIEFLVGGEIRKGGPGFWALAPSGVSHTFGNAGDSPAITDHSLSRGRRLLRRPRSPLEGIRSHARERTRADETTGARTYLILKARAGNQGIAARRTVKKCESRRGRCHSAWVRFQSPGYRY